MVLIETQTHITTPAKIAGGIIALNNLKIIHLDELERGIFLDIVHGKKPAPKAPQLLPMNLNTIGISILDIGSYEAIVREATERINATMDQLTPSIQRPTNYNSVLLHDFVCGMLEYEGTDAARILLAQFLDHSIGSMQFLQYAQEADVSEITQIAVITVVHLLRDYV